MPEDLLAMSKAMVTEAIHAHRLSSAEALSLLQCTHTTLLALQQREAGVSAAPAAQAPLNQLLMTHSVALGV